jgi:hypothetical protein
MLKDFCNPKKSFTYTCNMEKIKWQLPLKTVSESNSNEHWSVKSKRHRRQQFFVRSAFKRESLPIPFPCIVRLTRVSQRALDAEENLPMAFKWIKDELGACLFPEKVVLYKKKNGRYTQNKGHADSDPRVKWEYAQEKGKIMSVRIEIRPYPSIDPEPSHIDHE